MKKCPFCAEEIQDEAIVCKHCGRDIVEAEQDRAVEEQKEPVNKGAVTVLVVLVGIVLTIAYLGNIGKERSTLQKISVPKSYSVVYRIKGSSRASLTYRNEQENTEQKDVSLPRDIRFTAFSGQFLYISAQNLDDQGSVTCEIWVNNTLEETATSEGAYKIASCDMGLP